MQRVPAGAVIIESLVSVNKLLGTENVKMAEAVD